jgi:hypothetical protein
MRQEYFTEHMSPSAQDLDSVNDKPNKGACQIPNAWVAFITLSLRLRETLRKFKGDEMEVIR